MPFILTLLAGLSTLLGSTIIFVKTPKIDKITTISLSFTIGVMLTVSIIDLIPESLTLLNTNLFLKIIYLLISINIGIILTLYLDKNIDIDNKLYRVGVISLIGIIIHNIPEGIATYMTTSYNLKLGIRLALAISLHNIPEGICISLPIYYSTKNYKLTFLLTLLSGLSEVVGAVLCHIFLKDIINNTIMSILLGIISGIMIYISIFELLKQIKNKNKLLIIKYILIGSIIIILSKIITN